MLEVREIRVELGKANVLYDISLSIEPGEFVAVVGPNGAGKSTLLSVLSGALVPHEGYASLDGRSLVRWAPRALACKRAVLAQHAELSFSFRVLEVAMLGRSPHFGASGRERDLEVVQASLVETGVDHLADRMHTTLSGGERQRAHLARVLAQIGFPSTEEHVAGRYLLLDEPTSSLDPAYQHATLATARRAAGLGIGVLAILHDLNLAAMYSDRIVALRGGRMIAAGPPHEVLTEKVIRRVFEIPVRVVLHPTRNCPHVIAL